jgi:U3 small nucleolar RNA-associated protein 19
LLAPPGELTPPWLERVLAVLSEINMVTGAAELDSFLCGRPGAAAPDDGGAAHPLLSLSAHRREFSACWLAFLRQPHPPAMTKRLLLSLDRDVVPHLANPSVLLDYLTDAYNLGACAAHGCGRGTVTDALTARGGGPATGGLTSLLALNSLYYLISKRNLYVAAAAAVYATPRATDVAGAHRDYPDFFPKLYSLLDPALMFVKYRGRFFRLADVFLQSPYGHALVQFGARNYY